MRVQPIPFVGGSYADETRPWSMQDTVNYLPELAEVGGTRSESKLKTPPGLSPLAEIADVPESEEGAGDGVPSPPVRGTHNCEGKFFAVIGQTLYRLSNSGVLIPIGDVPGIGRVVMDHNQISQGNELTVVNGSAGYVYNTVTDTFARITDPGYPGAYVTRFIGGYMVGIEPRGRFAYSSAPANATSFNTLNRFTSEVSPDRLVGMEVTNNELLLLSETTGEFFQVTSNSQQPIRTKGITIDKGCAGAYTVVRADNTIFWLGSDGCFYSLRQYAPVRISKRPLEQAIRGLNWSQAFAFVWEDAGHTVVYWTFPDGRTWGYDAANGEWHRRESYGLNRWRVNSMTRWNNRWIAGDFQRGRLWEMDWDYTLEGDVEFKSERTLQVIHDNQNLMLVPRVELVMDTGQEETVPREFPDQPSSPVLTVGAPDGTLGASYAGYTYTATGGTAPYQFITRPGSTLASSGLSMNLAGTIGTEEPSAMGSFTNIVRVIDANGLWDEKTDTILIARNVSNIYGPITLPGSSDAGRQGIYFDVALPAQQAPIAGTDGPANMTEYNVRTYDAALTENAVDNFSYSGDATAPYLVAVDNDGLMLVGDATNGGCYLNRNGDQVASLEPTDSAPAGWWYETFNPEFGGLAWLYDDYLFLGLRKTGGGGGTVWNRICRWSRDATGTDVLPQHSSSAVSASTSGMFWMNVTRDGGVYALGVNDAITTFTLKRYDAQLELEDSDVIAASTFVIGSVPQPYGFGIDGDVLVVAGGTTLSSFDGITVYNRNDLSVLAEFDLGATEPSYNTRIVFNDQNIYVQRGNHVYRIGA